MFSNHGTFILIRSVFILLHEIVAISPYFSYFVLKSEGWFLIKRIIPLLFLTYNAAIKECVQE